MITGHAETPLRKPATIRSVARLAVVCMLEKTYIGYFIWHELFTYFAAREFLLFRGLLRPPLCL
ncbi:MAG TPA: hypothetical protein VGA09_20370, partial [Candidatus Binatia bacterium]